ncbi:thioredoxin domain-containing protein [Ornithinimicrobium sp. Y1847]|uniref:thioredoxin domain-containing protein n=1 Tax=Ornithinimicrobium sp. Y1847 TaxID=3405419 RepID=UPI003B675002
MANRLAASTSPYLQQHADNPVDWWEWGEEAFAEARRRGLPILLSVGYAACHWCHVMAHESFEDEQVAAAVNDDFIAIKVDREERPDVDAVYLTATTALTGHAGWPMTCLLTPDGAPFWAGTYLPKEHFLRLLAGAAATWQEDPDRVREGGERIVTALQEAAEAAQSSAGGADPLDEADLSAAVAGLSADFDTQWGGFGGAPKFPPSMVLAFLLRHHGRTGDPAALRMVRETCEAMARSGTYDQLGGGFARYAVDRAWVVPHFEKMLYDNALLLPVYTDLARADAGSRPWANRIVRETVGWLLDELWTEQAAFASSLDADTEGVEGLTYVWTPEQLSGALGEEDGARAAEIFGVTPTGTFEEGASTLQLRADVPEDERAWFAGIRERLLLHRTLRPQPARDDKVITAWNGLAVAALAHAGWALDEPDWVDVAARCARFLLDTHVVDGRLRRSSRDGHVGSALGVAEDYGNLIDGLLALHRATGDGAWLSAAGDLVSSALDLFDGPDGTFTSTGHDAERLVLTPRAEGDNAEPGGLSSLAVATLRHGVQASSVTHLERGAAALSGMSHLALAAPRFAGWALAGAEELLSGPALVRVGVGPEPNGPDAHEPEANEGPSGSTALGEVVRHTPSGILVGLDPQLPPGTAVVCRGTTCGLPTREPGDLPTAPGDSAR